MNGVMTPPKRPVGELALPTASRQVKAAQDASAGPSRLASGSATRAGSEDRDREGDPNDAVQGSGIDLAEEESLLREAERELYSGRDGAIPDTSRDPSRYVQVLALAHHMSRSARARGLTKVQGDSLAYLSLALENRLKTLLQGMILASRIRTTSGVGLAPPTVDLDGSARPLWSQTVINDTRRQFLALDKVARQAELKRKEERLERERLLQAGEDPDAPSEPNGSDSAGGTTTTKRAKAALGAGAAARNMSEESRTKMANMTALDAAGLGDGGLIKGWMLTSQAGPEAGAPSAPAAAAAAAATKPASTDPPPTRKFGAAALAGNLGKSGLGLNGLPRPRFAPGGGLFEPNVRPSTALAASAPLGSAAPSTHLGASTPAPGPASASAASTAATGRYQPYGQREPERRIQIRDALFVLERDCQGGRRGAGGADRVAMKWYTRQ